MAQKMTGKDLTELSELLESESLAFQKCVSYAKFASDPTLRDKLGSFANRHKARFEKLLGYLNAQ